ncbi:hypothetical protein F5Y03DRAFT_312928 [Xylaria venustula]|nr:hypothetical protein F5Y03DRAFT_312928 [Xylaria venustula]
MMYDKKALLSAAVLTGTAMAQTSSTSSSSSTDNNLACTRSYASLLAGAPTPSSDLASAITSYASNAEQSVTASGAAGNQDPQQVLTQACNFSSQLPSSLQSQFDAYATSLISYVSASSSYIDAVITNCVATGDQGASYTSFVNSFATHSGPLCQATGGSGGNGTSSSTGGSSSTGSGTGTDTGAGASTATQTSSGTGTGGSGGGSTTTGGAGGVGGAGSGTTTTGGENGGGSTSSPSTGAAAAPTALYGGAAAAAGILGAAILL